MSPENYNDATDELLASLLVAYDEALESDAHRPEVESVVDDNSLAGQLREAKACLELLDRVRRLDAAGSTPPADLETIGFEGRPRGVLPEKIGRFQIERELGRGGLGVVLLGLDPELGRHVAIKIPRADLLSGGELERRFLREAEAAARLSHPHLVALHEVGRDGPLVYLVSEYCPGATLAQWLKANPRSLSPLGAAQLVRQLAEAVHHAHSRGVLHRDIKPSNVLLKRLEARGLRLEEGEQSAGRALPPLASPLAGEGQGEGISSVHPSSFILHPSNELWPKLTDFGMAKLLESNDGQTRSGAILGTPAYMAPEQADGRMREVDARTDVYALGAVLYELLTGAPPYHGSSDVDTLRQLLLEEPLAPRKSNPAVPRDLEAICQKCLSKEAAGRFPTAQHLAEDLGRFLAGQPTEARPLGAARRLWKWARRRPALAALWAVIAASLITLFAVVVGYNARLSDEVTRAEREAEASRRLLYAADVRLADEAYRANNVPQMLDLLGHHVPKPGQEDLRGFDWHYLQGLAHQEVLSLGHDDEVFCAAWSPDGRQVATACKDGAARLWDMTTGKVCHILRGHSDEVTRVAFSPDGRLLASASEDGTVRLWEPASGEPCGVLAGHTDHVVSIAFSPDGKLLASGSWDKTVRVWNVEQRKIERVLEGTVERVEVVAFSPDGLILASGNEASDHTGALRWWRTHDWDEPPVTIETTRQILALAFSADLPWVAGAGRDDSFHIWNWCEAGPSSRRKVDHGHADKIQGLAFSAFDNTLASCDKSGTVKLWSVEDPKHPRTILGHTDRVWSVAFSPSGRWLATAGADRVVKIWDMFAPPQGAAASEGVRADVQSMVVSRDATKLTTASSDGLVRAFDLSSRRVTIVGPIPMRSYSSVRLAPDGRQGAVSDTDGQVIWSLATGDVSFRRRVPVARVDETAWSPDASLIATRVDEQWFGILDARTGREISRLACDEHVFDLVFSPDGRELAVVASHLQLFDTHTGKLRLSLDEADRAAFSPDGGLLASSRFGNVTLRDAVTGQTVRSLEPQLHDVATIRFSPLGHMLATAPNSSPLITLSNLHTGQQLMQLRSEAGRTVDFAFTPDGHRLVAVGVDAKHVARICQWSLAGGRSASAEQPLADMRTAPMLPAEDAIVLLNSPEVAPDSSELSCCRSIRAVNEWAARHGFVGGYPTFTRTEIDGQLHYQAVLFKPDAARFAMIPQHLLADGPGTPLATHNNQEGLLWNMTSSIVLWAQAKGYGGAFFAGNIGRVPSGGLAYQVLFLKADVSTLATGNCSLSELGSPQGGAALFRGAHEFARAKGYLSGFPTLANSKIVLLHEPLAHLVDIPAGELHTFAQRSKE
jgi:WD40 repeat protein/serine/threonine protein kinase